MSAALAPASAARPPEESAPTSAFRPGRVILIRYLEGRAESDCLLGPGAIEVAQRLCEATAQAPGWLSVVRRMVDGWPVQVLDRKTGRAVAYLGAEPAGDHLADAIEEALDTLTARLWLPIARIQAAAARAEQQRADRDANRAAALAPVPVEPTADD